MAAVRNPADLDLLPLGPSPDGVLPNFENPLDRSHQLFIVAGLCLYLITTFASLRVYAKVYVLRSRSADDCTSCRPPYLICQS